MYCRYQVLFSWPMVLNVGRIFDRGCRPDGGSGQGSERCWDQCLVGWDGGVVVSEDAGITPDFTNMETT